jgi:hypothetical protein
MSVSAIPVDIVAPARFDLARFDMGRLGAAALAPDALNFADMLISAQLQRANDLLGVEGAASSTPIEAHRSTSVVGPVQTTVITFTDGTTDIQTVTVDSDRRDLQVQAFPMHWTRIEAPIKADSDLEPEIGLQARRPSEDAMRGWKGRKAAAGAATIRSGTALGDRRPDPSVADGAQIDPADMGQLIDVLG